ncbi:MAG: 3-hydroxyacyl-ACP dehydratase FabZ [Rhodospirillales bacterium]
MDTEAPVSQVADLDVNRIMSMIPHRYPFLMIDRVTEIVPNESAVGIKNVTINEPIFQAHFPSKPIMPGVLIVEAMAQTAGVLVISSFQEKSENRLVYFMTIDNARFRKPVVPGDTLRIQVTRVQNRGTVWKFRGEAKVGDTLVAEATYSAMIVDE